MAITLLDGGMGQELLSRSGARPTGLWATQVMRDFPELVQQIHTDYFVAGADIATTNSYAIHRDRLVPFGVESQFLALQIQACEIANRARDNFGSGQIAGAIGPTGASYRPDLALAIEQGAEIYAEIAKIQAPYVDFILLETIASIQQATGAVIGAKQAGKPVWLAVSVDDDDGTKLRSGEDILGVLDIVEAHAVDALLINCSTPEAVSTGLNRLGAQKFPIGAYANGFTEINNAFKQNLPTVDALQRRQDLGPDEYLSFAQRWLNSGATIVGGCCEVGPEHIAKLHAELRASS
jgi:S-methylmethionine-dependent homocysteine/selenocysteine methylase